MKKNATREIDQPEFELVDSLNAVSCRSQVFAVSNSTREGRGGSRPSKMPETALVEEVAKKWMPDALSAAHVMVRGLVSDDELSIAVEKLVNAVARKHSSAGGGFFKILMSRLSKLVDRLVKKDDFVDAGQLEFSFSLPLVSAPCKAFAVFERNSDGKGVFRVVEEKQFLPEPSDPMALAEKWLPATLELAHRWSINGMDSEDVEQEARVVLVKCAQKWDPSRGCFYTLLCMAIKNRMMSIINRMGAKKRTAEQGVFSLEQEVPGTNGKTFHDVVENVSENYDLHDALMARAIKYLGDARAATLDGMTDSDTRAAIKVLSLKKDPAAMVAFGKSEGLSDAVVSTLVALVKAAAKQRRRL